MNAEKPITICIIKPDVKEKQAEIIKKIREKGYEIVESKEVTFTTEMAKEFYKNQANTVSFYVFFIPAFKLLLSLGTL